MNLNLKKGLEITINDDPNRVISFDPEDTAFAESFYALIKNLDEKTKEYDQKIKELETDEVDEYGIPNTALQQIELEKEIVLYFYGAIDDLFGAGTSKTAFGSASSMDLIAQFFDGITPLLSKAREDKLGKYVGNREQKRAAGLK